MSGPLEPQEQRVFAALKRLQLTQVRDTLAAVLSEAAREQWTYLEFLDRILSRELDAKQSKRVRMALQIAHFPCVRTLEDFDFSFQPSVDERLVRELAAGHFIAHGDNVLIFGPPGVGKSHLAIVASGHRGRACGGGTGPYGPVHDRHGAVGDLGQGRIGGKSRGEADRVLQAAAVDRR
jgi:DNA replication protein DnaC